MILIRWSLPFLFARLTIAAEPEITHPVFEVPAYVLDKLSAEDRTLFQKLARVGWSDWSRCGRSCALAATNTASLTNSTRSIRIDA